MTDCIFCRIVAGDLPSTRIHEDDRAIAIMDINPATRGHALVIPRMHTVDLRDTDPEDVAHAARVAQELAGRAMKALGAAAVNVMQMNGAAAGQTVFHYHVHVIPRYEGDGLRALWTPHRADPAEVEEISRAYFSE